MYYTLIKRHYIMWPTTLIEFAGVLGCVKSKVLFVDCGKVETGMIMYERNEQTRHSLSCLYHNYLTQYVEVIPFGDANYTGGIIYGGRDSTPHAYPYIMYWYYKGPDRLKLCERSSREGCDIKVFYA